MLAKEPVTAEFDENVRGDRGELPSPSRFNFDAPTFVGLTVLRWRVINGSFAKGLGLESFFSGLLFQ
jgi:hypothetical protein